MSILVTVRSLADVGPSETVRIERILFHTLQDLCYGLGLEVGDVVRCRRATRSILVLETETGRTIIVDTDWARFVEVSNDATAPTEPAAVTDSVSTAV